MMYTKAFAISIALALLARPIHSQTDAAKEYRLRVSPGTTWQERKDAFYGLLKSVPVSGASAYPWSSLATIMSGLPDSGYALRGDLIQALTGDVAWSRSQSSLTEEFTNYEADLIAAVTSFRDRRSLDVLFELVDSGDMALTALAGFGDRALSRALQILAAQPAATGRHSAVRLLSKMAEPNNLARLKDPSAKSKLVNALISSLRDESYPVRSDAIAGLVQLGDPSAIPALSGIAGIDPTQSSGDGAYAIRQQASEAIERLSRRR